MGKNAMRTKLIILLTWILLSLILLSTSVYAWLSTNKRASSMSFNILQIDSLVTLYEARDGNYNGIYDLLADEKIGTFHFYEKDDEGAVVAENDIRYTQTYYVEKYAFDYVSEKWAQSYDTNLNLFETMTIKNVVPGKIYGFKYEIINYIGWDNELFFAFEASDSVDAAKLSTFEVRIAYVSSADNQAVLTYSDWTSFVDENGQYNGLSLNALGGESMMIPGRTEGLNVGRRDLWVQIRQKEGTDSFIGDITLPSYRLSLSIQTTNP